MLTKEEFEKYVPKVINPSASIGCIIGSTRMAFRRQQTMIEALYKINENYGYYKKRIEHFYNIYTYNNNWRKMHHLPMRRNV